MSNIFKMEKVLNLSSDYIPLTIVHMYNVIYKNVIFLTPRWIHSLLIVIDKNRCISFTLYATGLDFTPGHHLKNLIKLKTIIVIKFCCV